MPGSREKLLLVIVGPTGVGKTQISIEIAREFNGEIVSADSRGFYRGLDLGTAKPGKADREAIPHHLVDILDPSESFSLAEFQTLATKAIDRIHDRNRLPLLVGGSGQYIRCITEGWQIPTQRPRPRLRRVLENWAMEIGVGGLYQRLEVLDPAAAKRIEPHNLRRIVRALEVVLSTGVRFSEQKKRVGSPYRCIQIGLIRPRPQLYERIDARIEAMIADGLIEEVEDLIRAGLSTQAPALSAIGYSEVVAYLRGETGLTEAIQQMKRRTRILVRRQANWFKLGDPSIAWFDLDVVNTIEIMRWLGEKLADFES